jgi:hypothetical protein
MEFRGISSEVQEYPEMRKRGRVSDQVFGPNLPLDETNFKITEGIDKNLDTFQIGFQFIFCLFGLSTAKFDRFPVIG